MNQLGYGGVMFTKPIPSQGEALGGSRRHFNHSVSEGRIF